MIKLTGVSKVYGRGQAAVQALKDVTLEIKRNEFVAVMGPSGSGKSTFLSILGCLERPSGGEYCFDGRQVSSMSEDELAVLRNRRIGFIFQTFNLLPRFNILRNVELPLAYTGVPRKERRERAAALLTRVGLAHRLQHKPPELSGGEQQRVAIARALVTDPPLILADEPTGNLDSRTSHEIMAIFRELHKEGRTIIIVTHEPDIARYAGRILHFLDGTVVREEVTVQ
ncbi:ABC transporter ATP-binding protein [Desulfofundulus sp. TPOSR]|uniref:ABC transport system ATP-binding protein n=1 Tax=Desulfofundulus luciae TaxID=74702 RepID=A0ABU0B0K7_9FIRM|nr:MULTISPECIES: ABC transporter ATP-binding protein [Desulfofundulus]MDQ0286232.1 putative ABC transport system ATP-binding protein [Desulfofundulus luciae]NHM28696.1 ABC transporter ATP-binding protein [Desulfofundulus sp. TPOSR]